MKGDSAITANTFLETSTCAAVAAWVGLDASSAVTSLILRPSTPPWALIWSIRASADGMIPVYSGEAAPDSEVMRPIVIVVAVTPGALAVLVADPPDAGEEPVVDAVVAPVVVPALFELPELPHAAASKPMTETATAARR